MLIRRLIPLLLAIAPVVAGCASSPIHPPEEGPQANEAHAARLLRNIVDAEEDWKYSDLDGNGAQDYWTRDVTGFFALDRTDRAGHRGVSREVALADPIGTNYYPKELKRLHGAPAHGYRFKALLMDERGWPYALDEDEDGTANSNSSRYGFVAYPERYPADGRATFLVNQRGIVWQKDLEGALPPHKFPAEPEAEGWTARDRSGARGGTYEPRSRTGRH